MTSSPKSEASSYDERRNSFVSEDLDDEPKETSPSQGQMEEKLPTEVGGQVVTSNDTLPSSSATASESETVDLDPHTASPTSPREVTSNRRSSLNSGDNQEHVRDPSPNDSSSSSLLATPHQPISDHFEPHESRESKRDLADDGDGFHQLPIAEEKTLSIGRPPVISATGIMDDDEICPLDTKTSATSPKRTTLLEPKSPSANVIDVQPTSPSSSPLRNKLSLIPSAIGYAAGLLPVGKTTWTTNADALSSPKSPSLADSEIKSELLGPHYEGATRLSAKSDLSSLHSATAPPVNIKDEATVPPPGTSWRSLTSLLGRGPAAPVHETASNTKPGISTHAENGHHHDTETPSTSFLLHHITSPSATADRRRSLELGGPQQLREGFERVKAEMVGAAKELRDKDAQRKRDSGIIGPDALSPLSETSELGGDPEYANGSLAPNACDGVDSVDWREFDIQSIEGFADLCAEFWGAVMSDYEEVARTRPKDLSRAIQQGIPAVVRGTIWQLMSSSKSIALEATYSALLKLTSPHEKAIQKDLARTFPQHAYFKGTAGGQESLFNVVKAYSIYDQDVGYTQGLAFIVAALLLNMPEEEAFCVFIRLMYSYDLRSHFLPDMPGLQLRMYQFDRLLEELLPALHLHMVRAGVKSSMYASQWFMTMFSYRFPLCLVYRIFDIVFAEGVEAIFRFSMALMRKNEDELLKLDFEGILKFMSDTIFECYKNTQEPDEEIDPPADSQWMTNDFVYDAYAVQITPFMLDSFANEWEGQLKVQNAHALELDTLRNANRNLSNQVKQLESAVATMNAEHVQIVKELVQSRIERESVEAELVRYKLMYADLAHEQQNAMSRQSRMSSVASQHAR
ncbi:hypothetical protein NliqN6_5566 [Naganishia liquefaciens]|uniref:GTPase-activating protein GYP5 n=1 Tax=Naganishia liquefaciens TaxID=104408 RepID=A0A8H3TZS2_9TREE|nr:hypothetical protein NliqN6_5566 [Naganishia liquefaciens]